VGETASKVVHAQLKNDVFLALREFGRKDLNWMKRSGNVSRKAYASGVGKGQILRT